MDSSIARLTRAAATTHQLYLHGFRSSPQSMKAVKMQRLMAKHFPQVHWWCPQLPPSPAAAWKLITEGTAHWPRQTMAVVGSSLGGFYATRLAEQTGCRVVLLNPAVHPSRDLAKYIGEHTSWHDPEERFFFRPEYVDELRALEALPASEGNPTQWLARVARGDEVLDWREMTARTPQARTVLLPGGDHALSDFDDHIPTLLAHLGLGQGRG